MKLLFLRRLRAGHDASDVRILLGILRRSRLTLGLTLLFPLGLLLLSLQTRGFFLSLLESVFRSRSHQRCLRPPRSPP